uniref:HAT C-terminal dimerisation domain-containing protein n=1 Tax=Stegastes partitus TaxID=144197 RepID=A0A3B5BJ07_9TELE
MSLTGQKHKIDNENRRFNTAWTEKYVFILPQRLNSKPLCLICNETCPIRHLKHTQSGNISHRCVCVFVFAALLSDLKKVEVVSIPVDESTERLDTAQLGVYVCVYDAGHRCFHGELLCLLPLKGHTAGEVFFDKIFFQDNGLDKTRVCMLVTDGAPSMTGKVTLHCIVHQALLCAKLNRHFKSVMDDVMATVNFIHATSSLQHRVFRQLLSDISMSIQREIITVFLHDSKQKKAEAHLNRIMDTDFMADVCFLSDLFTHLNRLNLGLQGKEKTIIDLEEQTHAFPAKLELFAADLSSGRMLHFPTLHKCITPTAPVTALTGWPLTPYRGDAFYQRPIFCSCYRRQSASKAVVPSIDEVQFILELVDMQSSLSLPEELRTNGAIKFWSDINVHQFPNLLLCLACLAPRMCQSSFSHMNAIKSNLRCSTTDSTLHHCLRIALTSYEPNVPAIVQNKTCHFSH